MYFGSELSDGLVTQRLLVQIQTTLGPQIPSDPAPACFRFLVALMDHFETSLTMPYTDLAPRAASIAVFQRLPALR
jgi:hypothetical protein